MKLVVFSKSLFVLETENLLNERKSVSHSMFSEAKYLQGTTVLSRNFSCSKGKKILHIHYNCWITCFSKPLTSRFQYSLLKEKIDTKFNNLYLNNKTFLEPSSLSTKVNWQCLSSQVWVLFTARKRKWHTETT
jgi:hypothetical protein